MVSRLPDDPLRGRILDVATELFHSVGYQGATADEISENVGITKRTLYRRMGDKETILFEIHERFVRDLNESLLQINGGASDKLAGLADIHLETLANHQTTIRVFYEETKHLSPANRAQIVSLRHEYWRLVQKLIKDEVDSGRFRPVDTRIAAQGILGALTEIYRWYQPDGAKKPNEIASLVTSMFLDGLATSAVKPLDLSKWTPKRTTDNSNPWVSDPVLSKILRAATTLFSRGGYQGTTTREIAEAVGITKAALYYHIGSKDELLFQIINQMNTDGVRDLKTVFDEDEPATTTFTKMSVLHARMITSHMDAFAVFNEDYKHLSQERRELLRADRDEYTNMWETVVRRGQASGEFRSVDPRLTVLLYMGSLNAIYRWYHKSGRLTPDEVGLGLADLVLHGLNAPAPVRARRKREGTKRAG